MGQKFSQIDGVTGIVEDNWGKVKETLLDILNNDIGKMEIAPRKILQLNQKTNWMKMTNDLLYSKVR